MIRPKGPEAAAPPSVQPEIQNTIADHIEIRGARHNSETGGDVALVYDKEKGTIGIVQPVGEGNGAAADRAANAGLRVFQTEFDPGFPRSTAMKAMAEVNGIADVEHAPMIATFAHPYEKPGGGLGLITASVGDGHAAIFPVSTDRPVIEPITSGHIQGGMLDGSTAALRDVQIDEAELTPGDRVIVLSSEVYGRIQRGAVRNETFEAASQARRAVDAAKFLIGNVTGSRDQIVMITDVKEHRGGVIGRLRERLHRRQQRDKAEQATAAAALSPIIHPSFNGAPDPGIVPSDRGPVVGMARKSTATGVPRPQPAGATATGLKEPERRGKKSFAAALGGLAVAGVGIKKWYDRKRDPQLRAERRAAHARGIVNKARDAGVTLSDKANERRIRAMAFFWGRRDAFHEKHFNDPMYAENRSLWTKEMIQQDLEHRRARRTAVAAGAIAVAALTGAALWYWLTKNPHVHTGTGVHPGTPPHSGLDQVNSPPGRHVPEYHGGVSGGNTPPPSGGSTMPPAGEAPAPNLPADVTRVSGDNLYDSTFEGIIHKEGHFLDGYNHFDGGAADRVARILESRHGINLATINGKPGTYLMADGRPGLTGPGQFAWASDEIAREARDLILQNRVG